MIMHLVKVRKKVFKREFLDFCLIVAVFDICELIKEEEDTIVEVNKVFWVMPMAKGMAIDELEVE
ncbi:hypothetical protein HY501_02750 [Candidatus Woesearchaeota archaeon]|nr:hypothetical protein [Candidatus Woesearchaeota archaeon]